MKNLTVICVLILFCSCANLPPVPDSVKKIKLLRMSDPSVNCVEVGSVHGRGYVWRDPHTARNEFRLAVHEAGGNLGVIEGQLRSNVIYGISYSCK